MLRNLVIIQEKIARRRANPGGQLIDFTGEPWEARTPDHLIKSQVLYLLS